jgi:hypothetical protein
MARINKGLKKYCRQYTSILRVLVVKKVLSKVNHSWLFLIRLPRLIRKYLVIKFKVNNAKPETYLKYKVFLLIAYKVAKSSLTNLALEL